MSAASPACSVSNPILIFNSLGLPDLQRAAPYQGYSLRRIGIHLSYWQTSWSDDLLPLIDRAHAAGFTAAEFPLLAPADLPYLALRARLDDLGMAASCGTGLGPATDITAPDSSTRKAGMHHLRLCLEGAQILGSRVLAGVTYAPWAVFPTDDRAQRRRQCVESLKEVGRMASDAGVTVCLEVLNRFEGYLINTVEQGLALLEEAGSPALKLHLDTFHMNIEEDHLGDAIRRAGGQMGHLHVVANNRKIPGQGHIHWQEVRQAVNDIDYNGFVVAETFVSPRGEVGQGLFIWRPLAEDLDAAAAQAAAYMRREFEHVG